MIVIGYGTGRCGTKSLAGFLNSQHDSNVTHEGLLLGWYESLTYPDISFKILQNRMNNLSGDVGFYWINYLRFLRQGAKAVNIVRPDEEVIESFWKRSKVKNYYMDGWYGYPFDSDTNTKDDIVRTIKRYRFFEERVLNIYPNSIYRMEMNDLNDESRLNDLLDWLGIKNKVIEVFHLNRKE